MRDRPAASRLTHAAHRHAETIRDDLSVDEPLTHDSSEWGTTGGDEGPKVKPGSLR